MKTISSQLSIVALAVAATVIASCGNPTASVTGNTAVAAAPTAGNSVFSYKIDGKVYAWEGNDPYANQGSIDAKGELFFTLMSNDPAEKNPPQFGFGVAATGSTTIDWDNMDRFKSSGSNGGNHFANFRLSYPNSDGKFPEYEFGRKSTVTVVVTSRSETRIKGTFSGDLVNVATQKPAKLADGKFDLPLKRQK
jgi:hypothetical protein